VLRARLLLLLTVALVALPAGAGASGAGRALRVDGSTTVNPVVVEAAEALRAERGLQIVVDTQGGSSGGIAALGDGRAEVAMISRPLVDEDRTRYPKIRFQPTRIGSDGVALVVHAGVWNGGVKALTQAQVRDIYEGHVTNWKQVGGPDRRIVFFNKEPGRGTWEVFAHWLYGDPKSAPLVSLPEVGANEEGRNKVAATPGGISQLSASWADGKTVFALALRLEGGRVVAPTPQAIADGSYPMARPLNVVTDGPPRGDAQVLIDFLTGPRGQAIVVKHGYLPLAGAAGAGKGSRR
jgi:phosphate transport system substrate-binding protein